MTQEDKNRPEEILEALKRLREELKPILKTTKDQEVYQSERGEAEIWEAFKSKYPPEMHSEMEKLLRDRYNGNVNQLAKDWMAMRNEEEFP